VKFSVAGGLEAAQTLCTIR